jgi:hypothetical protein
MVTVDQERDKVIDRSTRFFNQVAATRFVRMPESAPVAVGAD